MSGDNESQNRSLRAMANVNDEASKKKEEAIGQSVRVDGQQLASGSKQARK